MRFRPLLLLPVALLAIAAPASAQGPSRQNATVKLTETRPGTSSGLQIGIDYRNPTNPAAKPFAVQRVITTLAKGARIDTGVPAQCTLSDTELASNGTRGCPAASIVGNGVATFSSVDASPSTRVEITLVNNANELIFVAATPGTAGARLVIRSSVRGGTITTDVPRLPGGAPDGVTAIKEVTLNLGETSKRDGAGTLGYITTPSVCPGSGAFANAATFNYFDGVSQTVPSRSACVDRTTPSVALAGFPRRGCVKRDVRARVRVDDEGPLRATVVRLNGRKVKGSSARRFTARLRKARLRKGTNRVTVTAVDRAGNRFVRTVRFPRCR